VLTEIAQKTYRDARGMEHPYLSAEEVRFLSIPRGSLDDDERRQIESHVVHSFNFLAQIRGRRNSEPSRRLPARTMRSSTARAIRSGWFPGKFLCKRR